MRHARYLIVGLFILSMAVSAALGAADVGFATGPTVSKQGDGATVAFALKAKGDMEVAVLNAKGEVVRHLAAGVLGGEKAPPAPFKPGLAQSITWDGKDDFGQKAEGGPFQVRVRAGMQAKFGRMVGGDPYRFGAVNGLATDARNNLFVSGFGGESNQNMIVVRKFTSDGAYVRTLLPFPADLRPGEAEGVARYDASREAWYPTNRNSLNPTFYPWGAAPAAVVSAHDKGFTVVSGQDVYRFDARGAFIDGPTPMWSKEAKLKKPKWLVIQIAASPDGKYLYYANVAGTLYKPKHFDDTDAHWPQGRVYRQEAGSGKDPEKFYDLELPKWEPGKYWLPDAWNKRTAAYGLATDARGHVYVCDLVNQGIVEVDPAGKKVSFTAVPWPEQVQVNAKTGDFYVVSRTAPPKDGYVPVKLVKVTGRGDQGKIVAEMPLKERGLGSVTALGEVAGKPVIWVGGGSKLICVKDAGASLEEIETKYQVDPESQTDYNRLAVDFKRDHVYVNTGTNRIWKYDGMTGKGACLKIKDKVFHATDLSVGYDGLLYIRSGSGYSGPLERRTHTLEPAPFKATGSHVLTPYVYSRMGVGFSEHGVGVAPDGACYFTYMYDWNKYCVSAFKGDGTPMKGPYLAGKINLPDAKTGKKPMPEGLDTAVVGPLPMSNGGLRVDLQGNLYVGMRLSPEAFTPPSGFEKDPAYTHWIGSVMKFGPEGGTVLGTRTKDDQEVSGAKPIPVVWGKQKMQLVGVQTIYHGVGSFSGSGWGGNGSSCVCRVPRFDVDRYGRLVLPNVVSNTVRIVDNAGNDVIEFGKYGNFDSRYEPETSGGAENPLAATPDIPFAWPTCAGFSEKHVYVNDTYNRRVVRVDFTYAAEKTLPVK